MDILATVPVPRAGPNCRAVSPSAPAELAWILNLLVQKAPYAIPALAELDASLISGIAALRGPITSRYQDLWRDELAGCPELIVLADMGGCLLDTQAERFVSRLGSIDYSLIEQYELSDLDPIDRTAIRERVKRLAGNGELRNRYGELLNDVWRPASPVWSGSGIANVHAACSEWEQKLASAYVGDLVPPRHPLATQPELDAVFTIHTEFVVSPIHFCMSGGHFRDCSDFVHIGVPASNLLPARRLRDAMFVTERLRALSDRTRVRIIVHLLAAPATVMDLTRDLEMSQATVSGHVKLLRAAGLVQTRRMGARQVLMASRKRIERVLEDVRATLAQWD